MTCVRFLAHPSIEIPNVLDELAEAFGFVLGLAGASNGVRAGVRAVRDEEQPVPVQGARADAGVRGVRRGRGHRVAARRGRVPVPPPQGPPHHGPPGRRRLPARHQGDPHLIGQSAGAGRPAGMCVPCVLGRSSPHLSLSICSIKAWSVV